MFISCRLGFQNTAVCLVICGQGNVTWFVHLANLQSSAITVPQITFHADFIKCREDSLVLQKDLDNLTQWMDIRLLLLNIGKCKGVSYGRRPEICTNYNISGEIIEKIESIKDLEVIVDNKLKFGDHINNKISTAYQMLGIVKRSFIYLAAHSFVVLYKSMIRSHLEYAVSV